MVKAAEGSAEESLYPEQFDAAITTLKSTRELTVSLISALSKLLRASAMRSNFEDELEKVAHAIEKYAPAIGSGPYYETLQATSAACLAASRKEKALNIECIQNILNPIKSWVDEGFPRLMKNIKRLSKLKRRMERADGIANVQPTPQRLANAAKARRRHHDMYRIVTSELIRYKAVHRHQMQCLKVLMNSRLNFELGAAKDFEEAYQRCGSEIVAGFAMLRQSKSRVSL